MICGVKCLNIKMLMDRINPSRHKGVAFVRLECKED